VARDRTTPYLVVGASGPTGGEVVRALVRAGGRVRGLARSATSEQRARSAGAEEVAYGDLRDAAALEQAMAGAGGAFYFCPRAAPDEASLGRAFIQSAERVGMPRVVIISMLHSHAPIPNHQASLEVEEALGRSSLEGVVLQPAMFMQTLPSLQEIVQEGWVGRPYPADKLLSWVDMRDVAEVAARALLQDDLVNGAFELCSPGMLSIADVAALMSEHLGKRIEAREITLEQWAQVRGEDFASPYRRETYAAMFSYFARYGFKGGNGLVLSHLLGRAPTSFKEYVARGGKSAPPS
jgi:uncharacterized protein YbjT (DUF2867 family)